MRFREGQRLVSVFGPVDYAGGQVGARVGHPSAAYGADSIKVVMESGQMAEVPWALCRMSDGRILKLNLALMEEVELAQEPKS
jgi:hypothetical protein